MIAEEVVEGLRHVPETLRSRGKTLRQGIAAATERDGRKAGTPGEIWPACLCGPEAPYDSAFNGLTGTVLALNR